MSLDRFNLNLFFALDAILNTRSLTEAANKTRLTQPAMSVSLKKLRIFFNDELVVYQRGEMRLTALALVLRPRIRHILQASREILDVAPMFDPAVDRGTFTLAAPDVIELILLGPLVRSVTAEAPLMKLVSLPFGYQPVEALFRQPLDVAIVAEPFASAEFASEPLFSESLSCMVWKDGAYGGGISEAEYLAGRHVGISHAQEQLTHPTGASLQRLAIDREIVVRASSYTTLPHILMGTDLIVTTLTSYARMCADSLPVVVQPLPMDAPRIPFVAQWQKYRASEPGLRWLLDRIRDVAAARPSD
ncbi:LysR family transcriptional regulator [Brevundimonas sp.]|uniref:LysR family transcriptional regulator n=1 Tax=Brevundimonas sp. TaxID=1871086 RepID=UPI003D0F06CB